MKNMLIAMVMLAASGCAATGGLLSKSKPVYEAISGQSYAPPTQEDLGHDFIDISGNPEFKTKIKALAYELTGWIYWDVPYNDSSIIDVKETAKANGADGLILWRTNYKQDPFFNKYMGISVKTIKFSK